MSPADQTRDMGYVYTVRAARDANASSAMFKFNRHYVRPHFAFKRAQRLRDIGYQTVEVWRSQETVCQLLVDGGER